MLLFGYVSSYLEKLQVSATTTKIFKYLLYMTHHSMLKLLVYAIITFLFFTVSILGAIIKIEKEKEVG